MGINEEHLDRIAKSINAAFLNCTALRRVLFYKYYILSPLVKELLEYLKYQEDPIQVSIRNLPLS
jgi:hypothetical protein